MSKPDIRIYEYLIKHYGLNPEESLFIDDVEENVQAAEAAGMMGMVTNGSPRIAEQLGNRLELKLQWWKGEEKKEEEIRRRGEGESSKIHIVLGKIFVVLQ